MAAINTDQQLEQEMANLAGGVGGENIPQVTAVRPTVKDGEIQDATGAKIADANVSAIATTPTQVMPTTPTGTAGVGQKGAIERTVPSLTTMDTAQITPAGDYMQDVQGTVGASSVATAQTEELDERGTVKYQITNLLSA